MNEMKNCKEYITPYNILYKEFQALSIPYPRKQNITLNQNTERLFLGALWSFLAKNRVNWIVFWGKQK